MPDTPVTLLQRLCHEPDAESWRRFAALYSPLLYRFASRAGVPEADAADVVQDVFVALVARLPSFRYDPTSSFWRYLTTILRNKWRDRCRAAKARPEVMPAGGVPERSSTATPPRSSAARSINGCSSAGRWS